MCSGYHYVFNSLRLCGKRNAQIYPACSIIKMDEHSLGKQYQLTKKQVAVIAVICFHIGLIK